MLFSPTFEMVIRFYVKPQKRGLKALHFMMDDGFIGTDCGGFHIGQIFVLPCVQPLTNGHLMGRNISTCIQSGGEFLDLLRHFLLRLSGDRFLNLLVP